ncbi:MAG TPA: hypothetical protein VFF57_06455 [Hanamia sp.]|nr:hypothetical protein [Hanamia sp.]
MSVAFIVEMDSYFNFFPTVHQSNHWTFNIETIFEFYFFSYFFYQILKEPGNKTLIKVFVFAYPVILLISFFTIQKYYIFHTYTYMLGELYLIVLCLLYYRELYTADEFKKLSALPEFWIVTGLFVFCVGELPYMMLLNYLNKHYLLTSMYFQKYILGTLNIVMYAMFTIGLLWSTRKQKLS